jgi:hypothetical protein
METCYHVCIDCVTSLVSDISCVYVTFPRSIVYIVAVLGPLKGFGEIVLQLSYSCTNKGRINGLDPSRFSNTSIVSFRMLLNNTKVTLRELQRIFTIVSDSSVFCISEAYRIRNYDTSVCGSVVVMALCCKPEGRGFKSRGGGFF